MSQKYYVKANLEKISEDINFYFQNFQITGSKADEIRYRFSIMKFREVQYKENSRYRESYEDAKQKYERLIPNENVFSMNRK